MATEENGGDREASIQNSKLKTQNSPCAILTPSARACSSVDRASDSGSEGRGFESLHARSVRIL
jgi:hypothetical protein